MEEEEEEAELVAEAELVMAQPEDEVIMVRAEQVDGAVITHFIMENTTTITQAMILT